MLYKNEASALARNEALESASLTHVTRRSNFKGQVRRDAAKMTADESALGAAQEVEADWRRRMRADMCVTSHLSSIVVDLSSLNRVSTGSSKE